MANNPIPRQEYIRSGTVRSLNVEEELLFQGVPVTPGGGGGGTVATVQAGTGISVDATDPANPIVSSTVVDTNDAVKVSANDTTAGFLNGKLVAGSNITFTENNDGGSETLTINAAGGGTVDTVQAGTGISVDATDPANPIVSSTVVDTNDAVKVSANDTTAGFLNGKLVAGSNITFTENNDGGSETLTISAAGGGGGGLTGTRYIYVAADGTPTENGAALVAAYSTAQTMSPTSTSRVWIVAAPGYYTHAFGLTMATDYIDLVSLDGNRSVIFDGMSFLITATNAFVRGIVANSGLNLGGGQTNLVMQNCKSGDFSFGTFVTVAGTFIDCEAGGYSFGFGSGYSLSGTFIRCTAGTNSFGQGMDVSGSLTDCVSGIRSFAYGSGSVISGTLNGCRADIESFGSANGSSGITGVLLYCVAPSGGFGTVSGSGKIRLSIGNLYTEVNQG